jgi:hypothetical protein
MATNAKAITYKLRAKYEGKGDIKQLSADLKSLGQIEALNKLEESFVATNKQMVEAKAKVRALRKDMKSAGGEAFAESYDKAKKEVTKLNTSLKKQKENLSAARASMREQGVNVAALSEKYNDLTRATEKQGKSIASRQALGVRSFADIKAEIIGLEKAYKHLERSGTASVDELAVAQEKLRQKTARLNTEMGTGVKRYSKTTAAMQGLRKIAVSTVAPLAAMVGTIGLIGAGYGIAHLVSDVVAGEKAMATMANTAGMSSSDFQAFAFGIKTVGLEADKLADISKDVKDKIGDFIETGGGEFADFFENVAEQAGITAEELIKLSGPDALIAIKKGLDDANVSAENQVFYMEALANDASLLIPLLEDNGAAWKELAAQAKEMGVAISDLDAKQLKELATTMSELQLAMGIVKREAVLALAPAMKELAAYVSENTGEIRDFVTALAEGAGGLMTFVLENRQLIAGLGKTVLALYAISTAGGALVNTVRLVRTSMIALGPVGLLAVAALSAVGYGIMANVSRYQELNKLEKENAALTKSNAAANSELAKKFGEISKATGLTITSMEDLDQAVKDGKIHFDESVGEWKAGYASIASSAQQSATKQETVTVEALAKMRQAYAQHVDKIKSLQDEIAASEMSLYAYTRDLARTGMSDIDAYKDLKQQAEEYKLVAEAALDGGDGVTAKKYFKLMEDAYKKLGTSVDGHVTKQEGIKTKIDGVTEAVGGQIAANKILQEEEQKAMDILTEKSGFQDLTKNMDEVKRVWIDNWSKMRAQSMSDIDDVGKELDKVVRDREANIYYNVIEKKATGGAIGSAQHLATGGRVNLRNMLSGGHFPGFGGGDRRHVVAEDGEVMLRKESVRSGGLRAALAFNAGRFDLVVKELSKRFDLSSIYRATGGLVNHIPSISLPPLPSPQMLAAGGAVVDGESSVIRHEHNLRSADGRQATVYTDDLNADRLIGILQNAMVSSS